MEDIWILITQHTIYDNKKLKYYGSNYKSLCLVSKNFYNTLQNIYPNAVDIMSNQLVEIIKHFPNDVCWQSLSENKKIPISFIINNPDLPWSVNGISYHPKLTIDNIRIFDFKNFNPVCISQNLNITIDFIKEMIDKYDNTVWHWIYISMHPNITIDDISNNPELPWDWSYISLNKNITEQFIEENIDKPWDFDKLSVNPNVTLRLIKKYPNKPWDMVQLSINKFDKNKYDPFYTYFHLC